MKIIVLRGKTNSGKSSSLKYCFIEMLKDKEFKMLWKSRNSSDDRQAVIDDILNNWTNDTGTYVRDISGVFEYKGKNIFIVTIGDSIDDIRSQLNNCINALDKEDKKIDLFLCSRHDNNIIEDELASVNIEITDVIPIQKTRADNPSKYDKENKTTGEQLYKRIKKQLK